MHGEMDAHAMFDLHTKITMRKEISWTELNDMTPFEKTIYIGNLLNTIKEQQQQQIAKPDFDIGYQGLGADGN